MKSLKVLFAEFITSKLSFSVASCKSITNSNIKGANSLVKFCFKISFSSSILLFNSAIISSISFFDFVNFIKSWFVFNN